MDELSGMQSKWQLTRAALEAFVKDPGSAGLGVGLSFFPSKTPEEMRGCLSDQDCAGLSDPATRTARRNQAEPDQDSDSAKGRQRDYSRL
jgi:hypothetical protein